MEEKRLWMQLLASSISYREICKYGTSMTMNTLSEVQDNGFVQFVFDNADHNTRTVDGDGTFHVMGGVHQSEELISLSSGIVADDGVNCDSAEELGENAAKVIVRKRFADVTLKRKVQVFTLAAMENIKLMDTYPVVFNLTNCSTA
ncbi:hypothetical protein AVEN_74314-1 [Araneus ventricosus]|uniref:Uncharacterized protein n=1 Tax=Araneus ventricosus TaxID=182803 RepID=A0A4Y2HND7_ARAVE|nr:hypothetical protein AVEN_74314-1 [Araneus ventricosus]